MKSQMFDPRALIFARPMVNATSSAEKSWPSLHLMPERVLMVYSVSLVQDALSASHGMNLSASGSYRNRVSYCSPTVPIAAFGSSGFHVDGAPYCLPLVKIVSFRG